MSEEAIIDAPAAQAAPTEKKKGWILPVGLIAIIALAYYANTQRIWLPLPEGSIENSRGRFNKVIWDDRTNDRRGMANDARSKVQAGMAVASVEELLGEPEEVKPKDGAKSGKAFEYWYRVETDFDNAATVTDNWTDLIVAFDESGKVKTTSFKNTKNPDKKEGGATVPVT